MATLAAWMLAGFAVLTFGVRVLVQLRTTGETGLIGLRGGAGLPDWLSGILFIGGMAMGVVSVTLALDDSLETIEALDRTPINVIGVVLAAAGGSAVFLAQLGMGASWRIGVSDDQDTDLVTTGWFSLVRNPIYSAMIVGWSGFALMVPTWLSIAAVFLIAAGLELQVRAVEEPYLLRTHRDEYRRYASGAGRFIPGIGRIR
ncbi:MAG TPA: isoprenylcysteine carboxylmethyltransferase family protein [Solirubrobacterales bacterium]|nr:isoprenylcysteine carboxylmethyltransferase family protein [Solirubrobacterales bacterium]